MIATKAERGARRFWVLMILGFFSLDLSIAAIAITMAAGDPSFRSIPGYGERSVAWDERRLMQDAWSRQGISARFERCVVPKSGAVAIDGSNGPSTKVIVQIRLLDRELKPVENAEGTIRLFHYTRVASQFSAPIESKSFSLASGLYLHNASGVYTADVDVSKPGLWNIELDIKTRQGDQLWCQHEIDWTADPLIGPL
jgi:hypothetical protein